MRDSDVRAAVRAHLNELHGGDVDTRIVEEMGVWSGTARIDIAVINGELAGFELKSDRDTLQRLPGQADIYSRIFDLVTLVVSERHAKKAVEVIPDWWGIISARETLSGVALTPVKCGSRNPNPDPYLIADLLWKDEALAILANRGLARGWRGKPVKAIHQCLASELSFSDLSDEVRRTLKCRTWLRQSFSDQRNMAVEQDSRPL